MRFRLIDEITELCEGESIVAVKSMTGDEDYLKDHFPLFPVMPGVLMLESLFQAAMWLVRASEDFATSFVGLKEVRNAKFQGFVRPGEQMTVVAEIIGQDETTTSIKAHGMVNGNTTVAVRFVLERFNLADRYPQRAKTDHYLRRQLRQEFDRLYAGKPLEAVC